jgi:hypothetical protein
MIADKGRSFQGSGSVEARVLGERLPEKAPDASGFKHEGGFLGRTSKKIDKDKTGY